MACASATPHSWRALVCRILPYAGELRSSTGDAVQETVDEPPRRAARVAPGEHPEVASGSGGEPDLGRARKQAADVVDGGDRRDDVGFAADREHRHPHLAERQPAVTELDRAVGEVVLPEEPVVELAEAA